ncbi:MAG: hypothetical protein ABIZ91_06320 [Gemmatimonadaceae bacterium]
MTHFALPPPADTTSDRQPGSDSDDSSGLSTSSDARHEGTRLGLIVASTTWAWIAVVDLLRGHPFQTFHLLGGVALFTVVHFALNVLYGRVIASALRSATRTPSVIFALIFGLIMVQVAFAMITVLLSQIVLGRGAWIAIFGGSIVGTATAIVVLSRTHPLRAVLLRAEEES